MLPCPSSDTPLCQSGTTSGLKQHDHIPNTSYVSHWMITCVWMYMVDCLFYITLPFLNCPIFYKCYCEFWDLFSPAPCMLGVGEAVPKTLTLFLQGPLLSRGKINLAPCQGFKIGASLHSGQCVSVVFILCLSCCPQTSHSLITCIHWWVEFLV